MTKECFQAIKSLRTNKEILIKKPDKGASVVILNKNDYNDKMKTILNDATKFLVLKPVTNKNNTAKIESRIQRRLLQLRKERLISSKCTKQSDPPTALSDRACMVFRKYTERYVPLRPILSMTGSAQYQLAKWLTSLLRPVLQNLSSNCVSDSFTFVKEVRKFTFSHSSVFLCSFDISSLLSSHHQCSAC